MHLHLFPIPICSLLSQAWATAVQTPGASSSTRNAGSLSPWKWYGVTVWTAASCICHRPPVSCCSCVLLTHLPKTRIFSILTDTEIPGSFSTTSKKQRCKLTKFAARSQWLWSACLCASLAAARSAALCAQCQAAAKPAEGWHPNAARGEYRLLKRETTGQGLRWVRGCWTATTTPCSSQINFLTNLIEDSICTLKPTTTKESLSF